LNERGLDASIKAGVKSQFDVVADGETVFSKQQLGRWPDEGEVLALLSAR
jgi:hypothetical protein